MTRLVCLLASSPDLSGPVILDLGPNAEATAVTNVYRASRDLFLAQRFARHASPLTTTVYTHPSDKDMALGLRRLDC